MSARRWIFFALMAILACGCRIEPPLYLKRPADVQVEVAAEVELDVMWQINWEALWEYRWDVSTLGPLGYEMPASMRLHSYPLDLEGRPTAHNTYNFSGQSARLQTYAGNYAFLFHNNDSESILFDSAGELDDIYAYTRTISSGLQSSTNIQTLQQKSATKAPDDFDPSNDPVVLAPDGLFSLYNPQVRISDNLEDYEYIDGRYVYRIEGALHPATFIYLIQVRLHNNNGRIIGSAGGAVVTGMAERTDLHTGISSVKTVSVPLDVRINRTADPDLMGARVMTFGIPGCNAYDAASVAAAPDTPHFFVLSVTYSNASFRNIRIDITDQVRALPTGGVITIDLDVDDFPPPDEPTPGGGGGFEALVRGWEEQQGEYTIQQ
ncbi:MAG: DUF5119 domain-containing protein [Bacteroidales bacterium]|nr:DUF5119 domain-containing protein [Bacteroidales bacterium]